MNNPEQQQFDAIIPPNDQSADLPKTPDVLIKSEDSTRHNAEEPHVIYGDKTVSYLGVEVPRGNGGRLTPTEAEFKEEYFYLEGHYIVMREVATALLLNKPILLEGGTGVYNKTTTIARMCRDLNMNYCKVNFDRETAREDVIGGHTLKVDDQGRERLEWYDGDLMYAIRNGGVAFLDEYNRQSKLSGIINPIIDAILNGRKEITNPYNENERVTVHPDFRIVAAQNPPGFEEGHEYTDRSQLPAETFGRWIYRKLPIEYSEEEENKLLAGVIGEKVDINLPQEEFRHSTEGIPIRELSQIPGMTHWRREIISIMRTIEAKATGAKREMAKGQRQNLYFNPRLVMGTLPQYIAQFYNGDINETVKNAFETCVVGMFSSEEDRQKVRIIVDQASWKPPVDSRRRTIEESEVQEPESALDAKAEKEAMGIRIAKEIADLRSQAKTDEDHKAIIQKIRELKELYGIAPVETKLSGEILEQIEMAKKIMGGDFMGPEEVKAAFLDQVEISEVPAIPFSPERLKEAKKLGQMLILRVDKIKDNSDLTMERIYELFDGEIRDSAKVLRSVDRYKDEEFYKKDKPAVSWALVGKEIVPNSTSKNYLEQTEILAQYIKDEVFKGRAIPAEYDEAIKEFKREKAGIAKIIISDKESEWKEAARKLEELKLNQLTRQSPVETLYDCIVRYQQTGERLLGDKYTWTKRRRSDGRFVYVGYFDSRGAAVNGISPVRPYDNLGVSFSCSL